MYYIVDTYNPYERNNDVVHKFEFNGRLWCIREVDRFEWGVPQFAELPIDREFISYHVYENYDDALRFSRELKGVYNEKGSSDC